MSFAEQTLQEPSTSRWTPPSAYQQTRCELAAVPDRQLLVINLDIPATVGKVLSLLPELRVVEAALDARLRKPEAARVERLERYAWAALHAHACWQAAKAAPGPDIDRVARRLRELRRNLLRCLRALVAGGVLEAQQVKEYCYGKSHRDLAGTSAGLLTLCHAHWSRIAGKTPLSLDELDGAWQLVRELSVLLHANTLRPAPLVHAERECRQAFTLLLSEYTELRRAARFLYRRAEAEQRVPSLFRKRRATPAPQRASARRLVAEVGR